MHIKAPEMTANWKSKRIKLTFFSKTISKSLPGARADKARSQGCFSAGDELEAPEPRSQPRVSLTAKLSTALVHRVWISLQDPGMPRKHFEKGRLRP